MISIMINRVGKLQPQWNNPYIVKEVLQKGAYELVNWDGIFYWNPITALYEKLLCVTART